VVGGVIFDMGGTILDYGGKTGWRHAWRSACEHVHRALADADHFVEPNRLSDEMMRVEERLWGDALRGVSAPTISQEMRETFSALGLPLDDRLVASAGDAYGRGLQATCEVYVDSADTLAALKASGVKLGLVSNTVVPGSVHVHDLQRFGLMRYLDDVIFSSDAGLWKPDPGIFRLSMSRLGLTADDCVFVGDRMIDDVWGAQRAGLRAILKYRDLPEQDYAEGSTRGIMPDATIRHLAELPALIKSLDGRTPRGRA
jgi:putative hydrolase of the HAD superfamily